MSVCKITQLLTGVEYRAKSAAGVWRSLASDDALADGESVKVFSSGPEYGLNVYTLQNRVSGAWADALTIALDLPSGTSHTRTDKLTITGTATDSAVSITVAVFSIDGSVRFLGTKGPKEVQEPERLLSDVLTKLPVP